VAALPVQCADYTLWQHAVLGSEDDGESAISRQLSFWTSQLAGLPDQIDLAQTHCPSACAPGATGQTLERATPR
jgi:hypothetical protein